MVIYMLYIGLVLGHAMDKSVAMGNTIIVMGASLAALTSVTTFMASKSLGSTASLNESIKGNIAALLTVWVSFRFALQVVHVVPWVVYVAPVLAVGGATLVLEHMLSLSWKRSLWVVFVSGLLLGIVLNTLLPAGLFLLRRA